MKKVLAIGTAACKIAKKLEEYKVYQVFEVSNEVEKTSKYKFSLPCCETPEEYEDLDMSKLHKWAEKIKSNCTVFVCGASDTSGITLRLLEKLHKNKVKMEVVYFQPETELLSEIKVLHEKSVRGILQNFARSGLFENICLISNLQLEKLAGVTNVYDYYNQLNGVFSSTYYMLDVFKNTKPIISTFKKPRDSCRISTIGVGSLDGEETKFFPFKQEVDVVYYYGINEERLKKEENLFRTITDLVKSKITEDRKVSFGIFPTQYEDDYIYTEYFSPKIQNLSLDEMP